MRKFDVKVIIKLLLYCISRYNAFRVLGIKQTLIIDSKAVGSSAPVQIRRHRSQTPPLQPLRGNLIKKKKKTQSYARLYNNIIHTQ